MMEESIFTRVRRFLRGGYTLAEVKEMWAEQHYVGLSKGGVNSYEIAYKQAEPYHDWVFTRIRYKQWQSCINEIRKHGLGYSSQKKFKNFVGQVSDFAIKNEWAEYNFAKMLQLDRHKPVTIKRPFSEGEIRKLWKYSNRIANVDLVLILIYTGVRVSEFLNIKMEQDVYINDRYFIVTESKTEAGRNRMVPIHKDLIPFFKARVKYPVLACTKRGDTFGSYNNFRNMYTELMKKLDMNHTIHETRHTCATLLDSADANEMATKRILGHAGDNITRAVYIHKQLADLLKAIDLVKGKDI